jgi:hypothetical protein
MVLRVKSVTGTKIVLEAFDTTDTTKFPAGTGAGTLRKIDSWITMPQVMTLSTEGGDQQTISVQFLEDDKAEPSRRLKTPWFRSTPSHDPQLAIYKRLIDLDDSSDTTAVWFHNQRGKADRYYSAKVSFQRFRDRNQRRGKQRSAHELRIGYADLPDRRFIRDAAGVPD